MKPSAPTNDLAMPFAYGGDKTIIPESTANAGRATQEAGFPYETQLPINEGGVAPTRTDFNGILYLLSALNFWQQSGGMMAWKSTLNYVAPAIVSHNGGFWACLAESGPETSAGAVTPGTDTAYWQTLLTYLAENTGGAGDTGVVGSGNTVTLTGDTTGSGAFGSNGNVSVETTTATATKLRTARTVELTGDTTGSGTFDGSANLSISTTTATATKLRTARTITLGGDLSGSASFDGSANITIDATVESGGSGGSMVPDWSAIQGASVNTTYTASTNGYIFICYGYGNYCDLVINGTTYSGMSDDRTKSSHTYIPVAAGDKWKITGSPSFLYWLPAK